jgi:two-component system chemotaxis response regulator CheB
MNGGAGRDVVVIAASAGGVEALLTLLPLLPADLPASVLVVLHVPAAGGRALPGILSRAGKLPADAAVDGEPLRPGRIYVAPPDHHLLVMGGIVRLSTGPRHQGHRPAADPLFLSAALTAGTRTIAVVLSGTLDDGSAGSAAVENRGGLVLIQDPAESAYEGMPRAALAATRQALVLPLREIAARIDADSRAPRPDPPPGRGRGAGPDLDLDPAPDPDPAPGSDPDPGSDPAASSDPAAGPDPAAGMERQLAIFLDPEHFPEWVQAADPAELPGPDLAASADMTCPECGRPLHQDDITPMRFECPAGHAWSARSLAAAQAAAIGRTLRKAVVLLEEKARSSQFLADAAERQGQPMTERNFRSSALTARAASVMIRKLLNWASRAGITGPGSGGGP